MARMPSMVALLGLLAVAGYQNRDKIAGALEGMKDRSPNPDGSPRSGLDGMLGGLGDLLGGRDGAVGGGLTGGLGDLMESFKRSGQADVADSWINPDVPTKGLTPSQVEQAVGVDNLDELSQRLGLSRDELLARLSTAIPENIDKLTPGGAFPDEQRARDYFNWPSSQRS
jgi:uncharacterized protein YidB (DUF937 family)